MINLIYNEMVKLAGKRKLIVVTLIIGVLIAVFTYAQGQQAKDNLRRYGDVDWRIVLEQRIKSWESRLNSPRTDDDQRRELIVRIAQQRYYLNANVNPAEPGAATFVRNFIENGTTLLLPLMMMVMASDLVSSEHSAGTMKALLTRPARRWRILLSKYWTLVLSVSIIITIFGLLSTLISGFAFGFGGWKAPVLTGFAMNGDVLDTSGVHLVPQWQYIFMEFGLAWFVSLVVATLSFMLSVLIRSTAAGMGIMLACLISGMILKSMVASWESAKYLFNLNLDLIPYLTDASPPIPGMTLGFSMLVLLVWAAAALAVSFFTFTRRDVV
ncbi:ABC transporter permease subunit [Paenibacillus sp. HJGM_3]|uniref:ABC transporter permease subunit n=1 Tax=Paenibacillus sp. HJGM_3 TaxID=3379816 RepID=UPI00385DAB5C